jgi:hypothetical protein
MLAVHLLGGYVVEAFSLRRTLLTFGIAYRLTTFSPVIFPAWRQLRRPDPVPAPSLEPAAAVP